MKYKLERIVLLADLSSVDNLLLKYIKKLDNFFNFKQLDIIHWLEIDSLPSGLRETLAEQGRNLSDILAEELSEQVDDIFGTGNDAVKIHIWHDKKVSDLIARIDANSYDLMLLGKKHHYEGSGTLSSKLVRLSKTPCLFIPEMARPRFDAILAPIDFSKYSAPVVEMGLELAKKASSTLELVHVIKLSMQFFPYIKDTKDIKKELQKKAEDKFKQLKKKVADSPDTTMLFGGDEHISKTIYDYALGQGIDLIVLGRKGSNDDSDFLIGSVAERLIANDKSIPVLVLNQ
ncbi:MAG: universal stress protein [Mongoliibacter sp.]|uniref:universal stress protein n=1 Tax=Mongoliibacter sp. TaxID=2022438 RepID=UPI0012F2B163|nr:universal stress protein [Mongoliibacter sp.]TVP53878.1 MAG: universal stress protein [Mongoliibacter sp.]